MLALVRRVLTGRRILVDRDRARAEHSIMTIFEANFVGCAQRSMKFERSVPTKVSFETKIRLFLACGGA